MNTRIVLLALLLAWVGMLLLPPPVSPQPNQIADGPDTVLPISPKYKHTKDLTGKIENDGHCSATKFGPHALLTAGHCVNDNPNKIRFAGETMNVLKIIDDGHDNAIVLVDATFDAWAALGPSPKVGDQVYVFGYPAGYNGLLRTGYLSGSQGAYLIYDLNGYWGDSGSAIFDEQGRIVGLQVEIRNDSRDLYGTTASMKYMASLPFAFSIRQLEEARK